MRSHLEELRGAGGNVAIIGNGWPAMSQAFAEKLALPLDGSLPFLSDRKGAAYALVGMKRGVWRTLNPLAALNWIRANLKGFRQGRTKGDPWQQGGALVVGTDGQVVYSYASARPGDHPKPAALVQALARVKR